MKTPKSNKSKQPMNGSTKLKGMLEIVLVIALILIIPLFFVVRSQAVQTADASTPPLSGTTIPVVTSVPGTPSAPMPAPPQATAPVIAQGKEPPACTFPLAQTTSTQSAPQNYTFSDPQVVLTAPKGNVYHLAEWLPDNQRVLMTEALYGAVQSVNERPQETIKLYNPRTGESNVYAIRPITNELPSWNQRLNAVVYSADNFLSLEPNTFIPQYNHQAWISYGDPKTAEKLADNLPQTSLAIKPDGSETLYLSGKQITKRNGSMQALPLTPFDPTQWDYAKERRNNLPVSYNMAWQPGTSLVFLYSAGIMGGGGYTFILNADTGRVCELNLEGWAATGARWSADGRYLAIGMAAMSHPADLTLLDTITGKLTTLAGVPQGMNGQLYINDFIWAPDNHHLLAIGSVITSQNSQNGNNVQGLYLVDIVSGQSVEITFADKFYTNSSQSLAWSPDGSKLMVRCPTIQIDRICFISVLSTMQ